MCRERLGGGVGGSEFNVLDVARRFGAGILGCGGRTWAGHVGIWVAPGTGIS